MGFGSYVVNRPGFTPTANSPNWAIELGASDYVELFDFSWGGGASSSSPNRTGIFFAAEGVGAATSITPKPTGENMAASGITASDGDHATTEPAPQGLAVEQVDWNGHGGVVRLLQDPKSPILLVGTVTAISENQVVAGTQTHGCRFAENAP